MKSQEEKALSPADGMTRKRERNMPTMILCEDCGKQYTGMTIRDASRALANGNALPQCPECHKPLVIKIKQQYPLERAAGIYHEYIVDKVTTVYSKEEAEKQSPPFDPVMFFIREIGTEKKYFWPIYWTKDEKGRWWWGQYAPMLTADELRTLMDGFR